MQKLLENLSTPEQISFVISALSPGAVALANDPNGQHVIRYCLIHYPYEYHKVIPFYLYIVFLFFFLWCRWGWKITIFICSIGDN